MSSVAEKRARPIALTIFTLTVGALLASFAGYLLITFRGPPPFERPTILREVAEALNGAPLPGDEYAPPKPDASSKANPGQPRSKAPPYSRWETRLTARSVDTAPKPRRGEERDVLLDALVAEMLEVPVARVRGYYQDDEIRERGGPGRPSIFLSGTFIVGLQQQDGSWRVVQSRPQPLISAWQGTTLAVTLAVLLLLAVPSWLIARAISRPIVRLADAAQNMRLNTPLVLPDEGPREVRMLARSLGAMQARLLAQAQSRTAMLAAIAHDMGTPLSRIAFWIEQLPEESRARAAAEIDEMRAMLASVLRFARDERSAADRPRVDLGSLIDSLVEDAVAAGSPVTLDPGPRALVRADPAALRRLFDNLVANAIRYGERATVAWEVHANRAVITVDDAGKGFGEGEVERLFEPFVRGDPSRNRSTGGTGLGLSIVRAIAEAHGGSVTLGAAPGGGGRVTVVLPLTDIATG